MRINVSSPDGGLNVNIDYPDEKSLTTALTAAIPSLCAPGIMTVIHNDLDWSLNGSQIERNKAYNEHNKKME